jgi:anti-sigma B factor antagonist
MLNLLPYDIRIAGSATSGRRRAFWLRTAHGWETQVSQLHITAEVPTASLDGGADVIVLVASGELDYDSCPLLRTSIFSHIGAGKRRLVVDLSAVSFIDSMAIGVLVGTVARLRASGGGSLVVVCTAENSRVLRIFDISGVSNVIDLYRSREDALRALVAAWMIELPSAGESDLVDGLVAQPLACGEHSAQDALQRYANEAVSAVVHAGHGHGFDTLAR